VLAPNFSKLNPANRVKQLVSLPAFSRFLRSILPVAAIAYIATSILLRDRIWLVSSPRLGADGLPRFIFDRVFELAWKSTLVLLAWSVFDYMLERQHVAGELRMSREELKDDYKQTEGNPAIKARIRRLRRQTARRAMLEAARRATVVITNPTEFAVALEYKPAMAAPMVIAKGRNILARQIKEVARWQGIPMIENPPLAHALYRAAEIGQYIPPKLYAVVASILAAIYRAEQKAKAGGRREATR
jgi:flagellar biosynthetic protein FlhB